MTRLFLRRSNWSKRRSRCISRILWRITGCSDEMMRKIQNRDKKSIRILPSCGPTMCPSEASGVWLPWEVLVEVRAANVTPARQERRKDQAGQETADMRPPGHAAQRLHAGDHGQHSVEELRHKPESDKDHGRNFDEPWQKEDRHQRNHAGAWKEQQTGRQHAEHRDQDFGPIPKRQDNEENEDVQRD